MKFNVISKLKIWLIITLVVIVAGMTMLGIFGLNSTAIQNEHFEITVGVDQNVDGASLKAKEYAETYFAEKGISDVGYAYQTMKDGEVHVYKFKTATGIVAEELNAYVTEKLANDKVVVESSVNQVVVSPLADVWGLVLAIGISALAIFIYLIIMEKLFATLSVLVSGVLSALMTLSLLALTRIPSVDTWALSIGASVILSMVLSIVILKRCKEQLKLDPKANTVNVAENAVSSSLIRFAFIVGALIIACISLGLMAGIGYLTFVALTILVITISAVFNSLVWTPIVWSAINK